MSKKRILLFAFLGGTVCIVIVTIIWLVCFHANFLTTDNYPYRYDYNMDTYIEQTYITEPGGFDAYNFLPKYEEINNCSNISFGMCCNDSDFVPNWLFQFKSAYMVSLKYSSDNDQAYQFQKNAILENSDYKSFNTGVGERSRVYRLTSRYTDFPRHVAMLFYNDETKELIYLFLYDTKYRDVYYANRRILTDYPFSKEFFVDQKASAGEAIDSVG